MTLEEAHQTIKKLKQRNDAYLKVLDETFEPGRTKTRKKDYYRSQNQALEMIEELI